MAKTPRTPAIRNRVTGLITVKASSLTPNPANWRTHPDAQAKALRGVLDKVGYVDAIKVVPHGDGYMIVDGHLRAETTPDADVPVLVLDLTKKEADFVLATFDPLTSMAARDTEAARALVKALGKVESVDVRHMLAALVDDTTHLQKAIDASNSKDLAPKFELHNSESGKGDGKERNAFTLLLTADERTAIMAAVRKAGAGNTALSLVAICKAYVAS